jgi:ATP-binding cassette subfamily C protein
MASSNLPAISDGRNGRDGGIVRTPLDIALTEVKPAVRWGIFFGLLITLFAFAAPLYMMNLYERVLGSRNETTLIMLTVVVAFALLIQGYLEAVRSDVMRRSSVKFDRALAGPAFDAIQRAITRSPLDKSTPTLRDVDVIREFIGSNAITSLMDAIWFPIFLIVCFLIHPIMAAIVLVTGCLIALLTYLTSRVTNEPIGEATKASNLASRRAASSFQNYEAVQGMGMRPAMRANWQEMHEAALGWTVVADDRSVVLRTLSSFVRNISQTLVLAIAAYLVLHNQMTPGMIFAISIIAGKATQPMQTVVAQWKSIGAARQSRDRLQKLLIETPPEGAKMSLPKPEGRLTGVGLAISPPGKGVEQIIVRGVSFDVPAGSVLAIIGPSGSGKSSLLRVMLNVWRPLAGEMRLDGTELHHWNDDELGAHIGYLPQDVELFPGTIEQNIARFSGASQASVLNAAIKAGAHEMIQQLPEGYNTAIGEHGSRLSGGQRQRIGLARALFGDPSVIILDEPNSNLDSVGEESLVAAIQSLKAAGKTVVFVTHKVSLVSSADFVLVLGNGTVRDFGPRGNVMQKIAQPRVIQARSSAV